VLLSDRCAYSDMLHFEVRDRRWRARLNGRSLSWSEHLHGASKALRLAKAWLKNPKKGGTKANVSKSPSQQRHNTALIVKRPWTKLILDGKKSWEIRSQPTNMRGVVKLAESGTGKLVGQVRIVDCLKIKKAEFCKHVRKHRVASLKDTLGYKTIYAWVLKDAVRYMNPPRYEHPPGAIIWVKL